MSEALGAFARPSGPDFVDVQIEREARGEEMEEPQALVATFDDLAIDDTLGILERIQRYAASNIALQRLMHVKMLTEAAEECSYDDTVGALLPVLRQLAGDGEWVVRQHLAEQLPGVAESICIKGGEAGYRLVLEMLLPLVGKLLADRQEEVRASTGVALCRISKLVRAEDRGKHVLTIVLQLAHDDDQEELRMTAAKLLNDMVETLGPELCHQFVSPELVSLAEDPVFRVRKAAALNMHIVCQVGGDQETTDRLLPAYIRLTKDDIYRVRKACAESLVDISKAVNADLRCHILVEVFLRLSTDTSKFVRNSALQQLGPFIATLKREEVTPELVKLFVSMATPNTGDTSVDNEIRLFCAFSFPGVVVTVGRDGWSALKDAFALLVRDVQWDVRRTLACSLHEIAQVLADGQAPSEDPESNVVEVELKFALDHFLRDVDGVRMGVFQNFSAFLMHVSPRTRADYLNVLCDTISISNPKTWRPREILAGQLAGLVPLYSAELTNLVLVPLSFVLLEDAVHIVRERAVATFPALIDRFNDEHREWRDAVISHILELSRAENFLRRQLFLHVVRDVAMHCKTLSQADFTTTLLPPLQALASDPVPNVRIALARDLPLLPDWLLMCPGLQAALSVLLADRNRDVMDAMQRLAREKPTAMADLLPPVPPMFEHSPHRPRVASNPFSLPPPAPLAHDQDGGQAEGGLHAHAQAHLEGAAEGGLPQAQDVPGPAPSETTECGQCIERHAAGCERGVAVEGGGGERRGEVDGLRRGVRAGGEDAPTAAGTDSTGVVGPRVGGPGGKAAVVELEEALGKLQLGGDEDVCPATGEDGEEGADSALRGDRQEPVRPEGESDGEFMNIVDLDVPQGVPVADV